MWSNDYFTESQREQHTQSTTSFKLADFHLGKFAKHWHRWSWLPVGLSSQHSCLVAVTHPQGGSSCGRLQCFLLQREVLPGPSESKWALHGTRCKATFPSFSIFPHESSFRASTARMHNCPDRCLKTIYTNVSLSVYMNIYAYVNMYA